MCDLSVPYEAMVWLEREEQNDLRLLRLLLREGQTFVDCGANIGIWTIVATSTVGATGRVLAFEPNPVTFSKLSLNVSLSDLKPKLYNHAVGDRTGEFPFDCNESHNLSRIIVGGGDDLLFVHTETLDQVLDGKPVDAVKIDVEGFELNVLQGCELILKTWKPWLCIEFNTMISAVTKLRDWEVHQYLCNLGYRCRQFRDALDTSSRTVLPNSWHTSGYCNLFYSLS
jgi:FkbM family methyltransferase